MVFGLIGYVRRQMAQKVNNHGMGDLKIRSALLTEAANLVTGPVRDGLDVISVGRLEGRELVL